MQRVISLNAGSTEIVCALGFENWLVGRSHESDYPDSIKRLPVCTEPKLDPISFGADIEPQPKCLVKEALGIHRVHAYKLRDLQPDLIITHARGQFGKPEIEKAVWQWMNAAPQILSLEPKTVKDVLANIEQVANVLGAQDKGQVITSQIVSRINKISEKSKDISNKPRVACLEFIDPPVGSGLWIPELVEFAGANVVFGNSGQISPNLEWSQLLVENPDYIIFLPCGVNLETALAEVKTLTDKPEWNQLRAVLNNDVYIADGHNFFNRPGPRLAESLEILSEIIHPNVFKFGHEGKCWVRL